jgi:hypothetical protein
MLPFSKVKAVKVGGYLSIYRLLCPYTIPAPFLREPVGPKIIHRPIQTLTLLLNLSNKDEGSIISETSATMSTSS